MRIILAESMGMCFGVRDAIELALEQPEPESLTILGQLVHNASVLERLREVGIQVANSPDAPVATGRVMITAHGVADQVRGRLAGQGFAVQDATCPLVRHAHHALQRLVEQGYFPVVIGRADHVEVRGLIGDLEEYVVVESPADIEQLRGRPRIGIISQTTQPVDVVRERVEQIRTACPGAEVRFSDTVCRPTKERQEAARRLARAAEVVIVVGGSNSNNTRQLAQTCEREGARVYHVEGPRDLRWEWLEGAETVGITAGTSTPDEVVESVRAAIERLAEDPQLAGASA